MYKHASRNLQRAHRIDKPLATGGFIGLDTSHEDDFIPSAGNMDLRECLEEKRRLGVETTRAQNELLVAKRENRLSDIATIGLRIQTLCRRGGIIKARITEIREQNDPTEPLAEAIRELAPEELQAAIFKRAKAINKAKYG